MSLPVAFSDDILMRRCIRLAHHGLGYVSPNPPVGALIVHDHRIIAEGYHGHFGGPHAEVNAIRNVPEHDRHLLSSASLYVSLEPCCTHGKTPPCTELIIQSGITKVYIGTTDPNPGVAGKGIERLRANGIDVRVGIVEEEANEMIRPFRTHILSHRPFITLKWAQSKWGYIGKENEQVWLSHPDTQVYTHTLRHQHDAILVGARTVITDNPVLTTRHTAGRSPVRAVYDPNAKLNSTYRIFNDDGIQVHYFSQMPKENDFGQNVMTHLLKPEDAHVKQILGILYQHHIGSILIEGGANTIQLFIRENLWDDACVIRTAHGLEEGIKAPILRGVLSARVQSGTDEIVMMRSSIPA